MVLVSGALLVALAETATAQTPTPLAPTAAFVSHETVVACSKGATFQASREFTVICYNRNGPGQVEIHEKTTHVLYITNGEATFVLGGTAVDGKLERPGEIRAASVQGGTTHHVVPGDVLIVPAGTVHWFKEVSKGVGYFSVNPLKP